MRIGSLCTGYGGLDGAAQAVFGGSPAWHSDIDPGACALLAHRFPDVPNLGDMTVVDWAAVELVDVLTAGYPCQPFSHAGKRKGTADERHLWPHIAEAIRVIRPRIVVLENVAGHRSLGLDRVLGDLAEARYDPRWCSVRASDVGAPHRRERIFIVAADADCDTIRQQSVTVAGRGGSPVSGFAGPDFAADSVGGGCGGDARTSGRVEVRRAAAAGGRAVDWREYGPAVRRWERVLGRPAPYPTEVGPRGGQRLSARLVEWMMGLPAGWVTDVPGLSRSRQLKVLGNGVVPQQASYALRLLLECEEGQ